MSRLYKHTCTILNLPEILYGISYKFTICTLCSSGRALKVYSFVCIRYHVHCACTVLYISDTMCIVHVHFCTYQILVALYMCTFYGRTLQVNSFAYISYYVHGVYTVLGVQCNCTVFYISDTMCILHVQFCTYLILCALYMYSSVNIRY